MIPYLGIENLKNTTLSCSTYLNSPYLYSLKGGRHITVMFVFLFIYRQDSLAFLGRT